MEKDSIWWLFNIKDFIYEKTGGVHIKTKKNTLCLLILLGN